jgi:hypothetical protein
VPGIGYTLPSPSLTVDATTTLVTGGALDWSARASIVRRADDVLVLAYYRSTAHDANGGGLYVKFSDDDGATWTAENTKLGGGAVTGFPMNPSTVAGSQDAGEPWLIIAPSGDILCFMWRVDYGADNDGTYMTRSEDGGESWSTSAAVTITGASNQNVTYLTDDGFVYDGVIYAGAREYTTGTYDACASYFCKSEDDGATWTRVSIIMANNEGGNGAIEVGLEYLGDQTIIAMLRDTDHVASWRAWSTDMGATWTNPEDVTSIVGIAARQRLYTRAHLMGLEEWWTDPVLFMGGFIQTDPPNSSGRRNAVWVSLDRGHTWEGPEYVDTDTDDAGYGDLFMAGDVLNFVSYDGTFAACDLKQYEVSLS